MIETHDLTLEGGGVLRYHIGAETDPAGDFTILWHHGSSQTGALLEPLLWAAAERNIRLVSYGRPSYGGSSPRPGRNIASAASDVRLIVDSLRIDRFAVMGASGGGPHALACAALMPDRVRSVACFASPAPFIDDGTDWFGGMADGGEALRAAQAGREARQRQEETAKFNPASFNERDYATLKTTWAALGKDVGLAAEGGPDGLIEDDLALVAPWGFDVAAITAPVLLVQGGDDRVIPAVHAEWLLRHCADAELWLRPRDGHLAILDSCALAMDWLRARA